MRTLLIIATTFLVLFFTSCDKNNELVGDSTFKLNDTLELGINKSAVNNSDRLSITIDSVLNDSRCPLDVDCVWAGEATVRFIFTNADKESVIQLKISGDGSPGTDTIIGGYYIQMVDLLPYPLSTKTILNDEYVAELLIKKE